MNECEHQYKNCSTNCFQTLFQDLAQCEAAFGGKDDWQSLSICKEAAQLKQKDCTEVCRKSFEFCLEGEKNKENKEHKD